ncbi:MAG TPA: xanthine dehydrogenase family protein molybdopterin-binding subunit [Stellaceae bacterium]|jgi:carbon-monoxide dehydrogenase large subunit|nr:xanthine dehydrogenase family protein molybdopterin-binding subunit [Stellaceae bacterium]
MTALAKPETWVGRAIRRLEDPTLVAGQGRFTADLPADLHVRFVRSPVPAGRVVRLTAPAGVRLFRLGDLGVAGPLRPMLNRPDYQPIAQPILADEIVRYVGEPVAAVVARSAAEAEDHLELVELEIETTPHVTDVIEALSDTAPRVHANAISNVIVEGRIVPPDIVGVFATADAVFEIEVTSGRQSAMPLEPRGIHAAFDAASRRIVATCSTQNPHVTRTGIADVLGMRESDLRIIAPDVGGGFGQKVSLPVEYCVVTALARRLKKSVAWIEDRRENLTAGFHSRDQRLCLKGAFDAQGKLLALDADVAANIGAYSSYPTTCAVEPLMVLAEMPGPYDFQKYACRARGVATHTCPMGPYRGVSRPVITFGLERLMDKAARHFRLDPAEIRRRNLIDRFPYKSATGLTFDEGSYKETLAAALKAADLPAFRNRQLTARRNGRHLGVGLATFSERTGYGTSAFAARGMEITVGFETVEVTMDPSGYVEARIGSSPHGQGLRTTLSQIIADRLGVAPDRIRVIHGDTDTCPYGFGTFASRSLVLSGGASLLASNKLRAKLLTIAGRLLETAVEDIELRDGQAVVAGTDRALPIATIARTAYHAAQKLDGLEPGLKESATYDPDGTFSNACHIAFIELDPETGGVRLEKFIVAEDAGRLINPLIADGQIMGGIAQGIGNAILEEIVYGETGDILTATLADYLPPTAAEIPPIEISHLVTLSDATITKAKGIGEGGAIGAPAAVVNAINDALVPFGVEIDEFPATPRRIRRLLREAEAKR